MRLGHLDLQNLDLQSRERSGYSWGTFKRFVHFCLYSQVIIIYTCIYTTFKKKRISQTNII